MPDDREVGMTHPLLPHERIDYLTSPHTGRKDMVVRQAVDADGNPYFGTATSHTTFEADGTAVAVGSATVFDDMIFEIVSLPHPVYASSGSIGGLADAGTSSGTYADTRRNNGVFWKIEEASSTADEFISKTNPLIFDGIDQPPFMYWSGVYEGTQAHADTMKWQAYNNTSGLWDDLLFAFTSSQMYYDAIVTGFIAAHINANRQVKISCIHTTTGNLAHYLWIDEIHLIQDDAPAKIKYRGSYIESFRNTGFDVAHGKVQFRHAYKVASNFFWHCHFANYAGTIADGETVIFSLSKSFAAIYGIFPTEDTITATFTNSSGWRASLTTAQATLLLTGTTVKIDAHLVATAGSAISGAALNISAIGLLGLKRAAGTYAGDVALLYSDFHIEQDMIGSRNEFSKL